MVPGLYFVHLKMCTNDGKCQCLKKIGYSSNTKEIKRTKTCDGCGMGPRLADFGNHIVKKQ